MFKIISKIQPEIFIHTNSNRIAVVKAWLGALWERGIDRMPAMDNTQGELEYRSYLLRLWRESVSAPWRASLESVMTGQRHSFAQLDDLCAFLNADISRPFASIEDTHANLDR